MGGKLIVLEGLDGSGKATQTRLLCDGLAARGWNNLRAVSFPNYGSDSSALVRMYLSGAFGADPDSVNAYAASSFYAADRYAGYKSDWGAFYDGGGVVIADRYTTSNAIHQCAKLDRDKWDDYLDWLFDYEYNLLGIPAPELVLYLRVDPAVSRRLMEARYESDGRSLDIHERNLDYLRRSRQAADYCAARLGWRVIECAPSGAMRPVEDIQSEIMDNVIRVI